jgi:predicted RNA-binding Zn ribbon-like protein
MQTCGNRTKTRTYRSRRRSEANGLESASADDQ